MSDQKILLVEDSPSAAVLITQYIQAETDFTVITAPDFAQASALMKNQENSFFAAILGLCLPDAPNGEVVEATLANNIPSIVYTSQVDPALRSSLLSKDIVDYVIKNKHGVDSLTRLIKRLHLNREVKILVVEDSKSVRSLICSFLTKYMFEVLSASCAESALTQLETHPDTSIVITDYKMPGMDGAELCSKIRETYSKDKLAIIGLSASTDPDLTARFIKHGANDFLTKPLRPEELYCRVVQNQETIEAIQSLKRLNEEKNKLLGMAAHDLRTPINGIKGFSGIMLEDLQENDPRNHLEFVELIYAASNNMLQLVNDTLDISVIESGRLDLNCTSCDLSQLVCERVRLMQLSANSKKIEITKDTPEKLLVTCDASRIGQVLDNLLSNALKFSPVRTSTHISLTHDDQNATICVKDQGPGIAEKEQAMVFDRFKKLSNRPTANEGSTGLGLSIVKKIVETHGGSVWLESTPGKGSCFYFSIPVHGHG